MVDKNTENKMFILDNWSVILFLTALIFLISMWDVHIFFQDEKPVVNQLVNLEHGSVSLDIIKIPLGAAGYIQAGNKTYPGDSLAVPVFAFPVYILLSIISFFINIALFFILFWSVLIILLGYCIAKKFNNLNVLRLCAGFSISLFVMNILLFKPILFEDWGELLSIQFFNIIITSIAVVLIYQLFKAIFNERTGIFAALIFLFATPYSFWGVGVKDHALSVFLVSACFFIFHKYSITHNLKFAYIAYGLIAIDAWVRVENGLALFFSVYFIDILFIQNFFNEGLKKIKLQQIKSLFRHSTKIYAVMVVFLLPYFLNNYLIFGNPFFSGYSPPSELLIQAPKNITDNKIMIETEISIFSKYILRVLEPIRVTFTFLYQYLRAHGLDIESIFKMLYNSDRYLKSSVFQVNPLLSIILPFLIVSASRLIKLCGTEKESYLKEIKTRMNLTDIFFLLIIILMLILYTRVYLTRDGDGFSFDYRYFVLLYIPLVYFTVRSLDSMFPSYIEDNLSNILSLFSVFSCLTLYSSIIFLYKFFQPDYVSVIKLINYMSIIYILIIFVYIVIHTGHAKAKYLKYIISLSLSLSFFWVFMSDILGRAQTYDRGASMMLPISQYIHEFLRLLLTTPLLR